LKISIIMPCLNEEAFIRDQLDALEAQQCRSSWELLVADNGCSDGSMEIVKEYHSRIPHLRIIDAAATKGQAFAKNRAAREAQGDALLFVDADDVVGSGWLEAMESALEERRFVAARFDIDRLNPAWIRQSYPNPQRVGLNHYSYPPYLPHAGGSSLGVRRLLHEAIGGFDETMPVLEDTDYCWRIQLAGTPLSFVRDAVVHVRYPSDMYSIFLQAQQWGVYNVAIYKRYRPRGMPRLPVLAGLRKWLALVLRVPRLASRRGRVAWIRNFGWRLGRVRGSMRFRVLAL